MSRSYKRSPVYTVKGDSKYWKREANRKVRKAKGLGKKSKMYKKVYESWHICDYRFYIKREHLAECEEDLHKWKKYYYRK